MFLFISFFFAHLLIITYLGLFGYDLIMNMHTLIDNKFAEFRFNSTIPCVEMHWKGYVISEEFRKLLKEALIHFKQLSTDYQKLGWLANTVELGVINEEDQHWVEEYYNPLLFKAGLKYMAIVIPDDIFGKISIKDIVANNKTYDNNSLSYHMKLFNSSQQAEDWLREQLG